MTTDDLPELRYGGEYVLPERDSYSFTAPYGVRGSNIAGTLSTLSRGVVGGPFELTVTLQLQTPAMLVWWDDFYNVTITEGSQRFLMMLLLNGVIQQHVVQIVGNPKLTTPGWKGSVELKLQAVPVPIDRCTVLARQVFQACYGDQTMCIINDINEVANPYLNNAWNDPLEPDTWLDLKTSLNMRKGAGAVSFARATTGTYIGVDGVLKTSGVNQPRFESGGLLIEGQSQNLFLQSDTFNTTAWAKAASTITTGVSGPDGNSIASKFSANSLSSQFEITTQPPSYPVAVGSFIVMSIFAKAGERNFLQMWLAGGVTGVSTQYANFELTKGLTGGNATIVYTIPLANGWFRCVAIFTMAGDGTAGKGIGFNLANSLSDGRRPTGTANAIGDGIYISSSQLELGAVCSSYIPTTTTQAIRSPDTCWIQRDGNGNYFNPFTVAVTFDTQPVLDTTNINSRRGLFSGYPYNGVYEILMVSPTDNKIGFAYGNATFSGGTNSISNFSQRTAVGVSDTLINKAYLDGLLGTSQSAAVYTTGADNGVAGQRLLIGYGAGGTTVRQLNGHIKSVKLWKRALTAAEVKKVSS